MKGSLDYMVQEVQKKISLEEVLQYIQTEIYKNAQEGKIEPKSILESRFTTPQDAFIKKMVSCGSVANIVAEVLRRSGYEVKLVHGAHIKTPTHAWISVYDPETLVWKDFDVSQENMTDFSQHTKIKEVHSWEDMREELEEINAK
ncbi:MAG: transglutaminase domain-containing protein [Patescibacteria group bacterium UBA2103]